VKAAAGSPGTGRGSPRSVAVVLAGLGGVGAVACCVGVPVAALGVVGAFGAGVGWWLGGVSGVLVVAALIGAALLLRRRRVRSARGGDEANDRNVSGLVSEPLPDPCTLHAHHEKGRTVRNDDIDSEPPTGCACCAPPAARPVGAGAEPEPAGCGPVCVSAGACVCGSAADPPRDGLHADR